MELTGTQLIVKNSIQLTCSPLDCYSTCSMM